MTLLSETSVTAVPAASADERIRVIAARALAETGGRKMSGQNPKGVQKAYGRVISMEDFDDSDPVIRAKKEILWILLEPELNICQTVTNYIGARENLSLYMKDILHDRLLEILEQKTMQDPPSGFDLEMAATTKPVAWAKSMLERSSHSTTINRLRFAAHRAITVPFDRDYEEIPPVFLPENMEFDVLVDDIVGDLKYQRQRSRVKIAATTLREAYHLPELTTPASPDVRTRLIAELEKDTRLAHIALEYRIAAAHGDVDELLQVPREAVFAWMWYSEAQAKRLLALDPLVAHIVFLDALVPDPRPGRDHIRKVKSILRLASGRRGWMSAVYDAYDAFLDSRFELQHERSPAEKDTSRADEFVDLANAVAQFPGNPLAVFSVAELDAKFFRLTVETQPPAEL